MTQSSELDLTVTGLATDRVFDGADLASLTPDETGDIRVSGILDRVHVDPEATRVHVVSRDGDYSASIPIADIRSGGVITVEEGGYRLRVVDGTTLCWNVKDVATLRLTATKEPDSVPERPTH